MLSISDDDSPKEGIPKQDTSKASSDDAVDPAVKPNFVYIVSINVAEKLIGACGCRWFGKQLPHKITKIWFCWRIMAVYMIITSDSQTFSRDEFF
jgi:hypothetical protein